MRSPLRLLVPALVLLVLSGCGSAPSAEQSGKQPTKDAKASISEGARRLAEPTLSVVGVARRDRLNVRATPAAGAMVVARLRPLTHGLAPTGKEKAGWVQVRVSGRTGWVKAQYVGYLGQATDYAAKVPALDIAATRREVAAKAAAALGLGKNPVFVRVDHPIVVVDLLGAEDDSVAGARLRIVLEYGEAGFQVKEAASRPICARGVTPAGVCT